MKPQESLTQSDVNKGLKLVVWDGVMTEMMTALTTGAFLVAMALQMGASNFQVGILSALPTFTNLFQLFSIWLVRKFNNRRIICVVCTAIARVPLVALGMIAISFKSTMLIDTMIFLLFLFYLFGSVSGLSWNSWMKDLIPDQNLGKFFSYRTRLTQIINIVISLGAAFYVDYMRDHFIGMEMHAYAYMFIAAGVLGLTGVFFLAKTPEPKSFLSTENILQMLKLPLKDPNFRNLVLFNSVWIFAVNIATPFFTVFMMKSMHLPISYIIGLTILSQVSSILTVSLWGAFADRYSNKNIIGVGAPLYIACMIGFCFAGIYSAQYANLTLLAVIYIFIGISNAGVNLSLTNIGLKLAPTQNAIVYIAAKNIITAIFSSTAPLIGGILADYFSSKRLEININYTSTNLNKQMHLISLHEWNFLFLIGAVLGLIALEFLGRVKERGEVEKDAMVRVLRSSIRNNIKDSFIFGTMLHWHGQVTSKISGVFKPERLKGKPEHIARDEQFRQMAATQSTDSPK